MIQLPAAYFMKGHGAEVLPINPVSSVSYMRGRVSTFRRLTSPRRHASSIAVAGGFPEIALGFAPAVQLAGFFEVFDYQMLCYVPSIT
jgi:hypothetical protein